MEQGYLDETRRKRDEADRHLKGLGREIEKLHASNRALTELVSAYDTILEKSAMAEAITYPPIPEMPPDGDAALKANSQSPDLATHADDLGRSVPERRPEFRHLALPKVLDALMENPEFHKVLTVNDFVEAVYLIKTPRERVLAKRTFNGELSRAVERNALRRLGRGHYFPAENQRTANNTGEGMDTE